MSRTSSRPADQPNQRRAARKVSRASSSPESTCSSTPVSVGDPGQHLLGVGWPRAPRRSRRAAASSTPLSSATCSASLTVATSRSTPSRPIAPSSSRSSASRSSALCEYAGSGRAPGWASTTSRWTVFEPTSRTPSLIGGTLLPAARIRRSTGAEAERAGTAGACQRRKRRSRAKRWARATSARDGRREPRRRGSTSPAPGWSSRTRPTTSRSSAAT